MHAKSKTHLCMSFPNFRAPILLPLDTAPSAVYLLQSFQQRKGNSKYDEISLKENNQDNDIETKDIRARINSLHSISRKKTFRCVSRTSSTRCFCLFSMSSNRKASAFFLFLNRFASFASSAWDFFFEQKDHHELIVSVRYCILII
jgi:hypothetical protein